MCNSKVGSFNAFNESTQMGFFSQPEAAILKEARIVLWQREHTEYTSLTKISDISRKFSQLHQITCK